MICLSRCLIPAAVAASCVFADVRAWQDAMALPTYVEGAPDPRPQFGKWGYRPSPYPYAPRLNFTKEKRIESWRTLHLENEYLHCRVFPDLGGHLYSCLDKRNGKEMFYANPVIKKDDIGIRGSWVALGLESNFPAGHSRQSVSPVDFALRQNPDGSASAFVEAIDHVSGMEWGVEFVLHSGSAVLEQRVTLYNRSLARRPYYWWSNAAVALDDPSMRFVFPANLLKLHGGKETIDWPVNAAGVDQTLVANRPDQNGWFALGSREPFFGAYKPASRSGIAHFADPQVVPGKKMWYWGTKGDEYVKSELTDHFASYIEIQGGVFPDQEDFHFLEPEQVRNFTEYWIPVFDLGGISRVTADAVVNLERRDQRVIFEIGATHAIQHATIRLRHSGSTVFEATVDLTPATVYRHSSDAAGADAYTLQLLDSKGGILIEHTENHYDADDARKVRSALAAAAKVNPGNPESAALDQEEHDELQQHWQDADADIQAAIPKYSSAAVQKAAGRLAFELDQFAEAATLLAKAHSEDASDAEVAYYLGASQAMLGKDAEAKPALEQAAAAPGFHDAAALRIALIAARAKGWDQALANLKPLASLRARTLAIAILRHAGRTADAANLLAQARLQDPADSTLRFEAVLAGGKDPELWSQLDADAERVLDIADEYLSLGFLDDALVLLRHSYAVVEPAILEPGATESASSPFLIYYRAYCEQMMGASDIAGEIRAAGDMSMRYAYPFRPSTFRVLQALLRSAPNDAAMHFLLSRIFQKRLLMDQAAAELRKSIAAKPGFSEALSDLARMPGAASAPTPAAVTTTANSTSPAVNPEEIAIQAMIRAASGDAERAGEVFVPNIFSRQKQSTGVRRAYVEVRLQRALQQAMKGECAGALNGLDHLDDEDTNLPFTLDGFRSFTKAAHFQYYMAAAESACHDQKAAKRLHQVSAMKESLSSPEHVYPLLASWKLNASGATERIRAALGSIREAMATADAPEKEKLQFAEAALLQAAKNPAPAKTRLRELAAEAKDPILRYLGAIELHRLEDSVK